MISSGRRRWDFARPEFIAMLNVTTMRADPAGVMSRVLVCRYLRVVVFTPHEHLFTRPVSVSLALPLVRGAICRTPLSFVLPRDCRFATTSDYCTPRHSSQD
eukprot:6411339-Prymnesium_polylepis.1